METSPRTIPDDAEDTTIDGKADIDEESQAVNSHEGAEDDDEEEDEDEPEVDEDDEGTDDVPE